VTWLPPELETGEEPELNPPELELLELLELEDDEPELELEPELAELEPEEPELLLPDEDEPVEVEPVELEPVEEDAVLCVDPGRARARAPAVTTLAMVTAVVVDRTLSRPRSLAAMARRIPSRCALLM
jgi:hypothetical protein